MGLPFLQPMDIDPSGPSGRARRVSCLSSSKLFLKKGKNAHTSFANN